MVEGDELVSVAGLNASECVRLVIRWNFLEKSVRASSQALSDWVNAWDHEFEESNCVGDP